MDELDNIWMDEIDHEYNHPKLLELAHEKIDDLETRVAELEAFVEKAMANPMIAGMLD